MTEKELKLSKKFCYKTKERIEEEISCRHMIMSCLIYGGDELFYDKKTGTLGKYAKDFWVKNPKRYHGANFTKEELIKMYEEQCAEFEKGIVGPAGYDSEGCSYNYFKYADEL